VSQAFTGARHCLNNGSSFESESTEALPAGSRSYRSLQNETTHPGSKKWMLAAESSPNVSARVFEIMSNEKTGDAPRQA
jgi:hypothetical protein